MDAHTGYNRCAEAEALYTHWLRKALDRRTRLIQRIFCGRMGQGCGRAPHFVDIPSP
jgi:hypothetical protein